MDIAQINPGHALVIPKAHYAALSDLPEVIGAHLFTIAQRLAGVVQRSGVRCEGVNLFLSDGAAAGRRCSTATACPSPLPGRCLPC